MGKRQPTGSPNEGEISQDARLAEPEPKASRGRGGSSRAGRDGRRHREPPARAHGPRSGREAARHYPPRPFSSCDCGASHAREGRTGTRRPPPSGPSPQPQGRQPRREGRVEAPAAAPEAAPAEPGRYLSARTPSAAPVPATVQTSSARLRGACAVLPGSAAPARCRRVTAYGWSESCGGRGDEKVAAGGSVRKGVTNRGR